VHERPSARNPRSLRGERKCKIFVHIMLDMQKPKSVNSILGHLAIARHAV